MEECDQSELYFLFIILERSYVVQINFIDLFIQFFSVIGFVLRIPITILQFLSSLLFLGTLVENISF